MEDTKEYIIQRPLWGHIPAFFGGILIVLLLPLLPPVLFTLVLIGSIKYLRTGDL